MTVVLVDVFQGFHMNRATMATITTIPAIAAGPVIFERLTITGSSTITGRSFIQSILTLFALRYNRNADGRNGIRKESQRRAEV
jgi:hypothetical protein